MEELVAHLRDIVLREGAISSIASRARSISSGVGFRIVFISLSKILVSWGVRSWL